MYDDDGVGNAGKSNMAVEDMERWPSKMRNDGGNFIIDGSGDYYGGGRDSGNTETALLESQQK